MSEWYKQEEATRVLAEMDITPESVTNILDRTEGSRDLVLRPSFQAGFFMRMFAWDISHEDAARAMDAIWVIAMKTK